MTKANIFNQSTLPTPAQAALAYHEMGFEPLVLPPSEKAPKVKWKEPVKWEKASINAGFHKTGNVGIALGKRSSGLTDIDFDCSEAAAIAVHLLSDLPSFGRQSSRYSHRVVKSELPKGRYPFAIPTPLAHLFAGERNMLLEIRGDGHQTMFPPSVHPSGETVEWNDDPTAIPTISADELIKKCGLIAFLSVILNRYPRDAGNRDEICMALTGALLRIGCTPNEADEYVSLVARLAGDDEHEKRGSKSVAMAERIANKEAVWGLPELLNKLGISELELTIRKWLGQRQSHSSNAGRVTIQIIEGELPANVDQAEQALLDGGVGIFQRGETMIRIYRLEESIFEDGVNRSGGAIVMRPVIALWLKEQLARVADWERPVKGDKYVSCDPPAKIGNTYLARIGEWRLPVLNGVLQNPTLRRDGSIIQTEGYDQQTGLYLDCGNASFPVIPDTPSRDDAMKALAAIERPFRAFTFVAPIDKAVALAAVLTGLVRHNFPSAPMFVLDAPTAGTGKSLLAETIGVIATGSVPAVMSQGKTVEEDEKRLSSVLLAGDPIIVIDNCDREIRGDFICSMLTQRAAKIRPLGKSEIVKVPTRCLVLATGNNVILAGDISRRALVCRLDANSERPDLIRYDFDPRKEVVANRPELVTAGLTIIRAYLNSGDKPALPPIGSFEDWSMIRDALVWLGYPDISDTRERFLADDPNKNELLDTLCLWWECVGDKYISTADMSAGYAASSPSDVKRLAIHLVACTGHNAFNPRSVGKYLSKHVDRIAGGRVLRMKNGSNGSKRFQVVSSEPETPSLF